jgi:hypothetical protein
MRVFAYAEVFDVAYTYHLVLRRERPRGFVSRNAVGCENQRRNATVGRRRENASVYKAQRHYRKSRYVERKRLRRKSDERNKRHVQTAVYEAIKRGDGTALGTLQNKLSDFCNH